MTKLNKFLKSIFTVGALSSVASFSSCALFNYLDEIEREQVLSPYFYFNSKSFEEARAKWAKKAPKNYTLKYKHDAGSIGPMNDIIGNISVSDGHGTVEFENPCPEYYRAYEEYGEHYIPPKKGDSYYYESVEEIFDAIEKAVNSLKESFDNKDYNQVNINITYDETYGIPLSVYSSYQDGTEEVYKENGTWVVIEPDGRGSPYSLTIKNFDPL